jgi:hypothetical protein
MTVALMSLFQFFLQEFEAKVLGRPPPWPWARVNFTKPLIRPAAFRGASSWSRSLSRLSGFFFSRRNLFRNVRNTFASRRRIAVSLAGALGFLTST